MLEIDAKQVWAKAGQTFVATLPSMSLVPKIAAGAFVAFGAALCVEFTTEIYVLRLTMMR